MRAFLAGFWAVALLPLPSAAQSTNFTVTQLMTQLSHVHAASASFTETKSMALLTTKLQSTGTLTYVAPDYVRKTTLTPAPQDFILQSNGITLIVAGETRHFMLSQAPQLAGLVDAVRATLAGDLPALQNYYELSLSGDMGHWQLLLRPHDPSTLKLMAWMSVQGQGNKITEIDNADSEGGVTRMQVNETIQHAF